MEMTRGNKQIPANLISFACKSLLLGHRKNQEHAVRHDAHDELNGLHSGTKLASLVSSTVSAGAVKSEFFKKSFLGIRLALLIGAAAVTAGCFGSGSSSGGSGN